MSDSYEERMEKSKKQKYSLLLTPPPEKVPRQRLSVNEYLWIVDEYPWPQQPSKLPPPPSSKAEDNNISDNKTVIRNANKIDLDEGYQAIRSSKVVQYASIILLLLGFFGKEIGLALLPTNLNFIRRPCGFSFFPIPALAKIIPLIYFGVFVFFSFPSALFVFLFFAAQVS